MDIENERLERFADAFEVLSKHKSDLKEPFLTLILEIEKEFAELEKMTIKI